MKKEAPPVKEGKRTGRKVRPDNIRRGEKETRR